MTYDEFLEQKKLKVQESGFEIEESELNPMLFDFQKWTVKRALKLGKFAVFMDCGLGKGQPLGSKVLTLHGWKSIESLSIGEQVISSDGKPYNVKGVYPKKEIPTYRFYYSDGVSAVFDEDHLHICRTNNDRQRNKKWRVLSTKELLQVNLRYGLNEKSYNYDIPIVQPIEFETKKLPIKPYLLGVLLGDGCLKGNISISSNDEEIIKRVISELPQGLSLKYKSQYDYQIMTGYTGNRHHSFRQSLIDLGLHKKLSHEKFIPEIYLYSSIEDRLNLLRGLMDTDGYIKDTSQFYSTSPTLIKDVRFLIQSLGGNPTFSIKKTTHKDCYVLTFSLKTFNPFYLPRKANLWNKSPRDNGRWIKKIEFEKTQKTVCISVDSPDQSYVTENCIVTHNTPIQLEWANQVVKRFNQPVLIVAPLAVSMQTIQEGIKFHIEVQKLTELDYLNIQPKIYITNYEQLHKFDLSIFIGVVLDESGVIKNHEGKTRNLIIDLFANTQYKLACTATPSPNDAMELGNHSEFLNVMSRSEMLAMWFVHDAGKTQKWRLKKHSQELFYEWVSGWSVMVSKPSDIGFSAEGYDLPELNFIESEIQTEVKGDKLFNDAAVSATDFNAELRITLIPRLSEVVNLIKDSSENFIVWVKQNKESDYLKKQVPEIVEVRGNDSIEEKEKNLLGFAQNDFRILLTKSKIAQFGLNYQNCHNQIFPSLDFSFESLYQSIKRSHRFGQQFPVNIYIVTTDTMGNVIDAIKTKQQQFETMQQSMTIAVNKVMRKKEQMNNNGNEQVKEYKTDKCLLQNGDCVKLIKNIADESIGFSIFSPPFADLYTYSDELADMGNSKDYNEFLIAFKFLVKDLYRVLQTGRNIAVHCADLPIQKGKEGVIGLRDFSGMILQAFQDVGFIYHSRVTIWKNPVTEMQRTKALGLLHKQLKKDSAMSRVGIPDYLMIFRKDGQAVNPVNCQIDVDTWQKWASPVWYDIDYGKTLNKTEARAEKDEKHICPLQLETIERAIGLWTNPNDLVLSPFAGIGSELYQAIKMNRRAVGFELKASYFEVAIKNCIGAESLSNQGLLFE